MFGINTILVFLRTVITKYNLQDYISAIKSDTWDIKLPAVGQSHLTVCEISSRIGCGSGSLLMCCDRTIFLKNFTQYSSSLYTVKEKKKKNITNFNFPLKFHYAIHMFFQLE